MQNKLLAGVYVHMPFCSVHCTYCDFPITTRLSLSDRYYSALLAEIDRNVPAQTVDTVYFGGGTPSLAPVEISKEVLRRIRTTAQPEITIEANPDDVTAQKLEAWLYTGITRVSLGIQALEPNVLRSMLRQHTPETAMHAFKMAREAGFHNVNVDLILGFPGQTPEGFLSGVMRLIEIAPDHFSIYMLEVHERTALQRWIESGRASVMDEAEQINSYESAIELLTHSGYEHYEVSNFAKPGKSSVHNKKYWSDAPYYAYGAGACSYVDSIRTRNLGDVAAYIQAIEAGQSPIEETVHEDQITRARNALIFGLRQVRGIDIPEFESRFGVSPASLFEASFEEYLGDGLLEVSQNYLRLTRKGMLLSNEVLSSAI